MILLIIINGNENIIEINDDYEMVMIIIGNNINNNDD